SAQVRRSARACLQGNFLEGQEHLYAGPEMSTIVWYGFLPEPAHRPQITSSAMPVPDQWALSASRIAACWDAGSGARASTWSGLHRVGISITLSRRGDSDAGGM